MSAAADDRVRGQTQQTSHLDERDFKADGLRPYSSYRDLGVATATNGLATAHVIRMTEPFRPELGGWHYHAVQFQMVYVLRGWFSTEFEGAAAQVFRACRRCSGLRGGVLDAAAGRAACRAGVVRGLRARCWNEVIMPAEFETVSVEPQ